eukprot:5208411-Pyramimonas_sp.AAC.1
MWASFFFFFTLPPQRFFTIARPISFALASASHYPVEMQFAEWPFAPFASARSAGSVADEAS